MKKVTNAQSYNKIQ